jgi:purine-binding chemotaxis protein CheW
MMTNTITNTVPHTDLYEAQGEVLQLVSFQLGPEEYAIDILGVQEIIRLVEITHVPNAPYFVEGVVNLRGKVIPIINLCTRLGLSSEEPTKDTRIVVVEAGRVILGFIVDSVEEVLRLPEEFIEPPPSTAGGGASDFHKGVGRVEGRLLILLDLELLFGIGPVC